MASTLLWCWSQGTGLAGEPPPLPSRPAQHPGWKAWQGRRWCQGWRRHTCPACRPSRPPPLPSCHQTAWTASSPAPAPVHGCHHGMSHVACTPLLMCKGKAWKSYVCTHTAAQHACTLGLKSIELHGGDIYHCINTSLAENSAPAAECQPGWLASSQALPGVDSPPMHWGHTLCPAQHWMQSSRSASTLTCWRACIMRFAVYFHAESLLVYMPVCYVCMHHGPNLPECVIMQYMLHAMMQPCQSIVTVTRLCAAQETAWYAGWLTDL